MQETSQHRETSLKPRFLLIAVMLTALASIASWSAFQFIVQRVIEQWGTRAVQIQVRYESARLLKPLEREIALARQMAQSNVLRRWAAAQPPSAELHAEALKEMESYRLGFYDRSFFVARVDTGEYFHNNAANEYAGRELRYRLSPDKPADAWFYQLLKNGRDIHININPDEELGVTKLWMDVLLRDGERLLGVVGTGLDLEGFLREVVDVGEPGVTSLFVDHFGAIQLYKDERLIDFASLVKPEGQKNTIDLLLDVPAERDAVRAAMLRLREGTPAEASQSVVHTQFVTSGGKRHLLGMAYLPAIGWYDMTFTDLDIIMPSDQFAPAIALSVLISLLSLLLFNQALRRLILNPVARLEAAMLRLRDGQDTAAPLPQAKGEIGRLIQHFGAMAEAIRNNTRTLEDKVRERTEALNRLARVDALTDLVNRRGMTEMLEAQAERARRNGGSYGVLWLDVDEFKTVNDQYGHAVGDRALVTVGSLVKECVRAYDQVARWGGDEFLVLLAPCDAATLASIGERIRVSVEQRAAEHVGAAITVSVGGYLASDEVLESVLHRADAALYAAKAAGRNALRVAGGEVAEFESG